VAGATSFGGVVALIRKAEDLLVKKAAQADPADRACTLRGIYYGTEWSLDFKVESKRSEVGARIRNLGFLTYTGANVPTDPRPALGQPLVDDLQASQSIHDGGRGIDVGHVLIGLETRGSAIMRKVPMPGQGGTGIEIVTWLGDLGGGAASLARRRVTAPATPVGVIFNNSSSDYGVMDNLEGDAGGYLVACGSTPGGAPSWGGGGIADALANYLPAGPTREWSTRAGRFATALGATVGNTGITNASDFVDKLTGQLYDFAVWYAATRWVPSGELLGTKATTACTHTKGAAREVATVFAALLSRSITSGSVLQAGAPYPRPTAPGKCDSSLLNACSTDVSEVRKQLDKWSRELPKLWQ
jgi:hypothetical protein